MVQWCVCCHPRYLGGSATRSRFHPSAVAYPPNRGRVSASGRVASFPHGDRELTETSISETRSGYSGVGTQERHPCPPLPVSPVLRGARSRFDPFAVAHPVAYVCDLGFRGVSRPNSRCQFQRAQGMTASGGHMSPREGHTSRPQAALGRTHVPPATPGRACTPPRSRFAVAYVCDLGFRGVSMGRTVAASSGGPGV